MMISTKKKVVAIVLGALILAVWNAISWMGLPFHGASLHNIPESALNVSLLQQELPEDGIYHYPGIPADGDMMNPAFLQKIKTGPRIPFMAYKKGETGLFDPSTFLINFVFQLLIVAAILFLLSKQTVLDFRSVLTMTLGVGLLTALLSDLPQMLWFMFPLEFTLPYLLDYVISMGLLGGFLYVFLFRNSAE